MGAGIAGTAKHTVGKPVMMEMWLEGMDAALRAALSHRTSVTLLLVKYHSAPSVVTASPLKIPAMLWKRLVTMAIL